MSSPSSVPRKSFPRARLLTSAASLAEMEEERKKQSELEEKERKRKEREEKKKKEEEMKKKAEERARGENKEGFQ